MTPQQDAARWDIIHQKTHDETGGHSVYAEEKEKEFPRGSIVCDLGGGTGLDAVYFLKQGHQVLIFDISKFALDVAYKKAKDLGLEKRLIVQQVDFGLHKLPLKDNSVDVIYSRISLNYFPKDETAEILKAVYQVIKPGGKAFISLKSPDDEDEMRYLKENAVEFEPHVYIDNSMLRSRFGLDELHEILAMAGIADYQVNPYKEALGVQKKGHHAVLYTNEITFAKTAQTP